MDDNELSEPVVTEGATVQPAPASASALTPMSAEDRDLYAKWSQEMFGDDVDIFPEEPDKTRSPELPERAAPAPAAPESNSEENIPKAPNLWMDNLQQEEVEAQKAMMRDVVGVMLPAPEAIVEANMASEFALMSSDTIARMEDFGLEEGQEQEVEIGMNDE